MKRYGKLVYIIFTVEKAAENGHLHVIQWALSNYISCGAHVQLPAIAARHRQWKILLYLLQNKFPLTSDVAVSAAEIGDLEMLKWAKENGIKIIGDCATQAAANGHFEVFLWLAENQCYIDGNTFKYTDSIEILNWAKLHGYSIPTGSILFSLCENSLEVMKWLYENGYCPAFESRFCVLAARDGYLETLKWLRTVGCPWDENTLCSAAANGFLDIIKWAIENGCPIEKSSTIFKLSAVYGHLHILKWFMQHFDFVMPSLTLKGNLKGLFLLIK